MNRRQRQLIRQYTERPRGIAVYRFDLWLVRLACVAIIAYACFHA